MWFCYDFIHVLDLSYLSPGGGQAPELLSEGLQGCLHKCSEEVKSDSTGL